MRVKPITTIDELRAALEFRRSQREGQPRGDDDFLSRFGDGRPALAMAEDDAGVCAVALGRSDGTNVFVEDWFPDDLPEAVRAGLMDEVARGAERMGLSTLWFACPGDAGRYEPMGFAAKLHVQFTGPSRFETRKRLIRELRATNRVLSAGTYGKDIVNAALAVDRVDPGFAAALDAMGAENQTWLMTRWVGADSEHLPDGTVAFRRPRYIIAFHPRFLRSVAQEVTDVDKGAKPQRRLSPEASIVPTTTPGRDLAPAFEALAPTFVRHIAPVQLAVPIEGTHDDPDRIADAVETLELRPGQSFAVQCRKGPATAAGRHDVTPYTSRDVEIRAGLRLAARGLIVDVEHPEQVVSVYLDGGLAYAGVSKASSNVTEHADEHRRRAVASPRVSRAEHKLLEAIEVFGIELTEGMRALDLGAAPGGWSLVLAERGLRVLAVDPGEVRVDHPLVVQVRARAESLEPDDEPFDIVVNDMGLDPDESAAIMCAIAPHVRDGAVAVMTIKLPTRNVTRWIDAATRSLEPVWSVESLRHLFHNRQEVTALLRRREGSNA